VLILIFQINPSKLANLPTMDVLNVPDQSFPNVLNEKIQLMIFMVRMRGTTDWREIDNAKAWRCSGFRNWNTADEKKMDAVSFHICLHTGCGTFGRSALSGIWGGPEMANASLKGSSASWHLDPHTFTSLSP
jgi:hypothetical protein